eukprot:5881542-Prymnesium_polylepis.1
MEIMYVAKYTPETKTIERHLVRPYACHLKAIAARITSHVIKSMSIVDAFTRARKRLASLSSNLGRPTTPEGSGTGVPNRKTWRSGARG